MIQFDTIAAAALLDEQRPTSLKDWAGVELGVDNWGKGVQKFGYAEGDPPDILARHQKRPTKAHLQDLWGPEGMAMYCGRDVAYTHALFERMREKIVEQQPLACLLKYLVLPGTEAFVEIEANGLWLDPVWKARAELALTRQVAALEFLVLKYIARPLRREWEAKAEKAAKKGADPRPILGNDHFLRAWLFDDKRGLQLKPLKYTDTGMPSADEATLEKLDHPAARSLMRLRAGRKSLSFFDQWREWLCDCGRLHPYFNVSKGSSGRGEDEKGGTTTGRRSVDRPNTQQVPKWALMRGCFAAPPGYVFLEVDYSQVEVRIMAWLSGDETLVAVFANEQDVYRHFAGVFYGVAYDEVTKAQRNSAKPFVLGLIYGMQVSGFRKYAASMFGVELTEAEAERGHRLFFETYPGVLAFHQQQKRVVARDLQVESPTGRIRHLMNILSTNKYERLTAERQAINSPDQGTGGDMTLAAIVELLGYGGWDRLLPRDEVRLVGDVHDALQFEIRAGVWRPHASTILRVMENPRIITETLEAPFPIRMIAEGRVGKRWGQGTEFVLETLDDVKEDPAWAA